MNRNTNSDPVKQVLQRELERGERVLWQGLKLRRVNLASFSIFIFAIPWTAFALFWTAMAWGSVDEGGLGGANILAYAFPMFGLPFIAIGMAMMATPFAAMLSSAKTLFAVTDQRLLHIHLGRKLTVQSIPAERIGLTERIEGRDNSGSLDIALTFGSDSAGNHKTERFNIGPVADIRMVEMHVRDTARNAQRRKPVQQLSS